MSMFIIKFETGASFYHVPVFIFILSKRFLDLNLDI